jgi:hypothetical protein
VAEKALFSSISAKLTQKTLARVSILVVGGRAPGLGTPGFVLYSWRDFSTMEMVPAYRFSRADYRVSQVRVKYSTSLFTRH